MWIVLFDPLSGAEVGRTWRLSPPSPDLLARIKEVDFAAPDVLAWVSDQEPDPAPLVAAIEGGEVVSVAVAPAATAPELWLHVDLDGGTLSPDGLRYLAHGQELQVSAVLRQAADPESPAATHLGDQPITYAWAMELMDRSGVVRDCPLVQVVEGASSVIYTPPAGYYGYLILDESSFTTIGPYRVRLVDGPIVFKVVRALG